MLSTEGHLRLLEQVEWHLRRSVDAFEDNRKECEEVLAFRRMISSEPPPLAVLDGLNVAYQRRRDWRQVGPLAGYIFLAVVVRCGCLLVGDQRSLAAHLSSPGASTCHCTTASCSQVCDQGTENLLSGSHSETFQTSRNPFLFYCQQVQQQLLSSLLALHSPLTLFSLPHPLPSSPSPLLPPPPPSGWRMTTSFSMPPLQVDERHILSLMMS